MTWPRKTDSRVVAMPFADIVGGKAPGALLLEYFAHEHGTWRDVQTIRKTLNLSQRSVYLALVRLRDMKLIAAERRENGHKGRYRMFYQMTDRKLVEAVLYIINKSQT